MKRLHHAWVILAITFIALLASAAIRSTPAVLIVPLEREFGWSRTVLSAAISINLMLYGLIGPFAAGFINRYGPRRVMTVCALLLGGGILGTLWMRAAWQLMVLWGLVVGVGTGGIAIVLGAAVVDRWFATRRGLALGILTASSATGQLVFLPLLARLVVDHGWRSAALLMSGIAFCLVPLVLGGMADGPERKGLRPLGAAGALPPLAPSRAPPGDSTGRSGHPVGAALAALAAAARERDFWILAGTFFICGASTNGLIGTHLVPACMDHGMPEVRAAGLLAVMGVFDLVGTTASGWLTDRFDSRVLLFVYYGLRGLSLIYLPLAFDPATQGLGLFAVFYGLDWIATVPPTVALARRAFGVERAAIVFGWIAAAHQLGAAAAATVAGMIRSHAGNYDLAFVIAGGLCLAASAAVLFAGRGSAAPARVFDEAASMR